MLKRFFVYFLLIFFGLVFIDLLRKNLQGFGSVGLVNQGLAGVDFSFFSKKSSKNFISQDYGSTYFSLFHYMNRRHNGIDIVAKYGAPILAAASGEVIAAGDQDKFCYKRGFGKFIIVKNDALGLVLFYAHLGSVGVKNGAHVERGEKIGTVGASGYETGPHLHFSIFEEKSFRMKNKNGCGLTPDGRDLNPLNYLEKLRNS